MLYRAAGVLRRCRESASPGVRAAAASHGGRYGAGAKLRSHTVTRRDQAGLASAAGETQSTSLGPGDSPSAGLPSPGRARPPRLSD
eukprot:756648-Hanusia_phi.AAC.1